MVVGEEIEKGGSISKEQCETRCKAILTKPLRPRSVSDDDEECIYARTKEKDRNKRKRSEGHLPKGAK